jgi:hypothetical protein
MKRRSGGARRRETGRSRPGRRCPSSSGARPPRPCSTRASPARAPAASSRAPSSRRSTSALLLSAGTPHSRFSTSFPSRNYNWLWLGSISAHVAFSASAHIAAHSCRTHCCAGVRANAGPGVVSAAHRHLHQAHHHARQVQAAGEGARAIPGHGRRGLRAQPRVLHGPCLCLQQERPLRRGVCLA